MDDHSDLLPSLNALHKHLCSLDFYKDFKDKLDTLNANLETKDDGNADAPTKTSVLAAGEKIKMRFETVEEYEQEWNDVFMIEAKAQIMRGSTTERQSVDDFLLKGIVIDKPFYNINLELAQNQGNTYRFYDFVVLAKSDPEIPQVTHLIGIVDYFSGHSLKLKCYMEENSEKYLQFYDLLTSDSQWKVQKICNLATLHREYQGIWAVSKVQFLESILDPQKVISGAQEFFEIPEKLRQVLVNMYNPSQMEAIQSSLKKAGVTLIQGPPGTGKTNTIRGILSVLLNSTQETRSRLLQASNSAEGVAHAPEVKSAPERKKALMKAMPWLRAGFRDSRDEDKTPIELPLEKHLVYPVSQMTDHHVAVPKFKDNVHFKPDRILICAPSNAAIDQIIRMVLLKGILDNEGHPTFPSLVRIGPNYHESLKDVSLEYMANNEINAHPNKTIAEVRTEVS